MSTNLLQAILQQLKTLNSNVEQLNVRVGKLEKRMDSLEGRFDSLEGRFDNFEGRFDSLEGRFDNLEGRFDSLEGRFDNLEGRFDSLEGRVENIERTMATKDDIKKLKAVVDGIAEQVAKNAENITKLLFYHENTTEKLDLVDKRQNTHESILSVLSKRTLHHEEELIRLGQ